MKLMKTTSWMLGALCAALTVGCSGQEVRSQKDSAANHPVATADDEEDDDGQDVAMALGDIPEAIKQAALAAIPGLALTEAERETEDGATVYSLEGTAGGERVEVEVSADGKVLEIERGDDEDDDEDDD